MGIQYKPTKQKKEKPIKAPKAQKPEKAVKLGSAMKVKASKPTKAQNQPKAPKPDKVKAVSLGKAGKVQTDKPIKVDKVKKTGMLSKLDPKLLLGGALVVIVAIAVVVLTVVLPAIEEKGQQIKSIEITRQPNKTVYLVGEEADYEGLRVTVTRNNGETFVVGATDCEISGFGNEYAIENCIITVTYQGYSDIMSLKIIENEKPKPVLESITLDPEPRKNYTIGEPFDVSGIFLVRQYVDGSEVRVNLLATDVYGLDKITGPGEYELTVRYSEDGVLCTTTYTITVTE